MKAAAGSTAVLSRQMSAADCSLPGHADTGIHRHRQAGGSACTKPGKGAPSRQQEVWSNASSPGLTHSSLYLMPVCSIY